MSNKITLKKLSLVNFKGISDLSIEFAEYTNIHGANGTGKTTIFDAFTWLLFGKDSTDRKDFEVKTLDENNQAIPKIEHEVSAIIDVNGDEVSVKRVLKEKWVKQRGALESEFTGNETLYYWNEVPVTMKEFQNKVSQVLDEAIFKLITSPTAFNSLKWQDRRKVLIQIAGHISDDELAAGNSDYEKLVAQLSNKNLEEYKKQIAATIKKAKDDIKTIPTRIDEVQRSKPDPVNIDEVKALVKELDAKADKIDQQIHDKSAAYSAVLEQKKANQDKIYELKSQCNAIEFNVREKAKQDSRVDTSKEDGIRRQISDLQLELNASESKLAGLEGKAQSIKVSIFNLETLIVNGRQLWSDVNAKELVFDETQFCCPTCKRDFDPEEVESKKAEMKHNFITNKQAQLKNISDNGKANAVEKEAQEAELIAVEQRIQSGKEYVTKLKGQIAGMHADLVLEPKKEPANIDLMVATALAANMEYLELQKQINELEAVKYDIPESNDQALKAEKQAILNEILSLHNSLAVNDRIAVADKRINELLNEESKLAQQIADIEREQYTIDNFIKLKIDTVEDRINQKFSYVKFKLFETQINGGQVETCEALINGVPFSDANTASKINAGVDIINTLCEFYKVSAPVFIDNRESVSHLIESNSQIINLIVSPADKKLRVE